MQRLDHRLRDGGRVLQRLRSVETGDGPYEVQVVELPDEAALDAFVALARSEGIVGAFESCHALAHALKLAEERDDQPVLLVNLSGRGDKDVDTAIQWFNVDTRGTGSESGRPVGTNLSADPHLDLALDEDGPASTTAVQL